MKYNQRKCSNIAGYSESNISEVNQGPEAFSRYQEVCSLLEASGLNCCLRIASWMHWDVDVNELSHQEDLMNLFNTVFISSSIKALEGVILVKVMNKNEIRSPKSYVSISSRELLHMFL